MEELSHILKMCNRETNQTIVYIIGKKAYLMKTIVFECTQFSQADDSRIRSETMVP